MRRPLATEARAFVRSPPAVAVAGSVVALALSFYNGFLEPFSLAAMTFAAVLTVGAAVAQRSGTPTAEPLRDRGALQRVLGIAIGISVVLNLLLSPGYDEDWPHLGLWRPCVACGGVIVLSYGWRRAPRAFCRARFLLLLALGGVMAAVVIRAAPDPRIDVWDMQQVAAQAVLRGENPYAITYPNARGPETPFLDKSTLSADGKRILWYPYLPLTVLVDVPSFALAGDIRWTMAACVLLAAWAIRRLGRATLEAELAAVLFLFQPRGFFVLREAWTEPTVLAAFALTLMAITRWFSNGPAERAGAGSWIAAGLAWALLISSKQYSLLLSVPILMGLPERGRWKAVALAALGAAVLAFPFVVGSPGGFYDGVVAFQLRAPFRSDALSWPAAVVRLGGPRLPNWPSFALAGLTLAASLRWRVSLVQAVTSASASFLSLLLLAKQAFCNYYWLAASLLCIAAALHGARLADAAARESKLPG